MILLVHLLLGATIASKIQSPVLAIILAFFSHYLLDLIPHTEYPIENLKKRHWHNSLPDILRIFLDFCLGILLISVFFPKNIIIFVSAFFAILPDGLTVLNSLFPNKILGLHDDFHRVKIHFLKNKKISFFWRIANQVLAIIVVLIMLKL